MGQGMKYAVIIYTDTTSSSAVADYMRQRNRDKQEKRMRWRRHKYFFVQRLTGVVLLLLTVLGVMVTGGDATMALITVPLGMYLLLTKEMVLVNRFYRETKRR